MRFSIMFCHWKTGKMSAYTIAQLLKYSGKHDIEILVVNNNPGDGSEKYFEPFKNDIQYFEYPPNVIQSHGCGYNMLMERASNEYVIALESDSPPIKEDWLDYYVRLINEGYDCAGSLLSLSGGQYIHPAGTLYKRSVWVEAWKYCKGVEYHYFPNMCWRDGFAYHLMVHHSILASFLNAPEDYVELSESYKGLNMLQIMERGRHYSPVTSVFHNGMGKNQELIYTYGGRTMETECTNVLLDNKQKLIRRVGAEPGQWFAWWMKANGYKIFEIPTEIKWLPGKENQQQEYTLNEAGVKHYWGISAYHGTDLKDGDVAKVKQSIPDELYNTLPEHQKIKDGD